MSEDAPGNPGAVDWPEMTRPVHGTEDADQVAPLGGRRPSRRFGDLFNLVYDPAFLADAWERVSTNTGAKTPGIDKATVARIETGSGSRRSWTRSGTR